MAPLGLPDNPPTFSQTTVLGYVNMESFRFVRGNVELKVSIFPEFKDQAWNLADLGDQMIPLEITFRRAEVYNDHLAEDEAHLKLVNGG